MLVTFPVYSLPLSFVTEFPFWLGTLRFVVEENISLAVTCGHVTNEICHRKDWGAWVAQLAEH